MIAGGKRRAGSRAQEALAAVLRTVKDTWARAGAGRGRRRCGDGRRRVTLWAGMGMATDDAAIAAGNCAITRQSRTLTQSPSPSLSPSARTAPCTARRNPPTPLTGHGTRSQPASQALARLVPGTHPASPAPASASASPRRPMAGNRAWPTTPFRRPVFAVGAQQRASGEFCPLLPRRAGCVPRALRGGRRHQGMWRRGRVACARRGRGTRAEAGGWGEPVQHVGGAQ